MPQPATDPGLRIALLAAGVSNRLGRPKQLICIDGVPLIRRAVDRAATWVDPVWVELGPNGDPFWQALDDHAGVRRLDVRVPEPSLSASLRTAVTAAWKDESVKRLVVMLVDQYRVDSAWLGKIIHASNADPTRIIASRYAGVRGAPVLFPRHAFEALLGLQGDRGAGTWLRQMADATVVDVVSDRDPGDLDTPEHLEALLTEAERTPE